MKNDENNQKPINKNIKILEKILVLTALAAILTLAPYVYDVVRNDPNLVLKKIATDLKEDSTVDVTYAYKPSDEDIFSRDRIPLYSFTPEESGDYTFSVSNVVSDEEAFLSLEVSDSHFNNYLSIDNMDDIGGEFSDTVFLNGKSKCYVLIEPFSEDGREEYSGSFSLNVKRASGEEGPPVITESEPAVIRVREDSQTAALFDPEESGFFRFESRVISRDKSASSAISSVNTADNEEIKRSEGICYLEAGKEYYVWTSATDLSRSSVKAEVSCKRIDTLITDQTGEYSISGDTIIEFTAQDAKNLVIYSVSDGNIRCCVYDSMGFPLNSDDDSGGDLSGNKKDFALVMQAQAKMTYLIYTEGQFSECSIVIAEYAGDGSSIEKDSIRTGTEDENTKEEKTENENAEGGNSVEENTEDENTERTETGN